MANNKLAYGATTPFAITLATLAPFGARTSAAVDNATTLYVDAHVSVKFTLDTPVTQPASGVTDHLCVYVYAYGMEDGIAYGPSGGPSGREAIDGTDKLIQINAQSSLWGTGRLCAISRPAGSGGVTFVSPPLGVAQAFGGVLPRRWGIIVHNSSGFAFTVGSASYTGISSTTL